MSPHNQEYCIVCRRPANFFETIDGVRRGYCRVDVPASFNMEASPVLALCDALLETKNPTVVASDAGPKKLPF